MFIFNITIGNCIFYVVIKHKDRLVEYLCKDQKELNDIILKSDNNVLFFDGEYFYDEPPAFKNDNRVKIIKWDNKIIHGDIDSSTYFWSIFAILLCIIILCGATSEKVNNDDNTDPY